MVANNNNHSQRVVSGNSPTSDAEGGSPARRAVLAASGHVARPPYHLVLLNDVPRIRFRLGMNTREVTPTARSYDEATGSLARIDAWIIHQLCPCMYGVGSFMDRLEQQV